MLNDTFKTLVVVEAKIDGIVERLESLEDAKIDGIAERLGLEDAKIDGIAERLERLETAVGRLETSVDKIAAASLSSSLGTAGDDIAIVDPAIVDP